MRSHAHHGVDVAQADRASRELWTAADSSAAKATTAAPSHALPEYSGSGGLAEIAGSLFSGLYDAEPTAIDPAHQGLPAGRDANAFAARYGYEVPGVGGAAPSSDLRSVVPGAGLESQLGDPWSTNGERQRNSSLDGALSSVLGGAGHSTTLDDFEAQRSAFMAMTGHGGHGSNATGTGTRGGAPVGAMKSYMSLVGKGDGGPFDFSPAAPAVTPPPSDFERIVNKVVGFVKEKANQDGFKEIVAAATDGYLPILGPATGNPAKADPGPTTPAGSNPTPVDPPAAPEPAKDPDPPVAPQPAGPDPDPDPTVLINPDADTGRGAVTLSPGQIAGRLAERQRPVNPNDGGLGAPTEISPPSGPSSVDLIAHYVEDSSVGGGAGPIRIAGGGFTDPARPDLAPEPPPTR